MTLFDIIMMVIIAGSFVLYHIELIKLPDEETKEEDATKSLYRYNA